MEIQLKNVKFYESLSEETNAFTADVFYKGKKVGQAKNDGQGGCTFVNSYDLKTRDQFAQAEKYAESLPDIKYEGYPTGSFTVKSNMESLVDRLFGQWLENKEIQKYQKKSLYYEESNGRRMTLSWKGWDIKRLLEHPQGRIKLKNAVLMVQKEGGKVLNTNLGSILE